MDDATQPPSAEQILEHLDNGDDEAAIDLLGVVETAAVEQRKATLQSLRATAENRPALVGELLPAVAPFLDDDERSVRLTTAKLFVAVAKTSPEQAIPVVSALTDRLADADEFYYVRARSAEALGYVALERPEVVTDPETLAELRIGLSFDEPEVKEKLAKAVEYVALGDPARLEHQLPRLADHLDDENELVRYHLCTAFAAVGCESPAALVEVRPDVVDRLDDDNPYVRGRAAETVGLLAQTASESVDTERLASLREESESFVSERARFALEPRGEAVIDAEEIGTSEGIRTTTGDAVDAITTPEYDGECPHCGCPLPENGPPMCPQCGAPY